jgi:hypothetical protein
MALSRATWLESSPRKHRDTHPYSAHPHRGRVCGLGCPLFIVGQFDRESYRCRCGGPDWRDKHDQLRRCGWLGRRDNFGQGHHQQVAKRRSGRQRQRQRNRMACRSHVHGAVNFHLRVSRYDRLLALAAYRSCCGGHSGCTIISMHSRQPETPFRADTGGLATPVLSHPHLRRRRTAESRPRATASMGADTAPAHPIGTCASAGAILVDTGNDVLRRHRNTDGSGRRRP